MRGAGAPGTSRGEGVGRMRHTTRHLRWKNTVDHCSCSPLGGSSGGWPTGWHWLLGSAPLWDIVPNSKKLNRINDSSGEGRRNVLTEKGWRDGGSVPGCFVRVQATRITESTSYRLLRVFGACEIQRAAARACCDTALCPWCKWKKVTGIGGLQGVCLCAPWFPASSLADAYQRL